MTAFADHGADGNGEPLAIVLRAGNAGLEHRRRPHRDHPAGAGAAAPAAARAGS